MAPTEDIVKWQTSEIIKYLLEDDDDIQSRQLDAGGLECDGPPGSNDDNFDPVLIADKLRSVADALNEDYRFKAALTELKKAAAQEAADLAFCRVVEAVSQTQVSQSAEVTSEVQLIRAAMAFGLYVKKSSPELKNRVHGIMATFINRRVGPWVTKQGGWDKVNV